MKRLFIISFIFGAFLCRGEVRWLATTHDFGAFSENMGPVSCDFRFVNSGDKPVLILNARPSCGCTTPFFDRQPIAPGDTASVTVSYDPAGRPGKFSKFVGVELSDGEKTKLYVKGSVIGSNRSVGDRFPMELGLGLKLSKGMVMFGQVDKGHVVSAPLDLYNQSERTMTPSASCPPHIKAVFQPTQIPPGEMGTVLFTFDSSREPLYGFVNDTILVSADPISSYLAPLPTVAVVSEDFSSLSKEELEKAPCAVLETSSLDFGRIAGKDKITRTIRLTNAGKSKLTVRRVYTADEGIVLKINKKVIKPGKSAEIKVTVDPTKLSGSILNARASVITNSPSSPVLSVRLVGTLE